MSGTIILIDGVAGCGKTTVLAGMPGPRALLDTDTDGARWLRDSFSLYSTDKELEVAKKVLGQWADMPMSMVSSIAVDVWAYFWQLVAMQVLDKGGNTYRAWGPAKMSVKKLYDPLKRAKKAGKHICLTAHTKDDIKVDESGAKTEITKVGQKADTEAMLNDLLDVHLRMCVDFKKDMRWFETVKCRPQRDFKPLLPARIDIGKFESQLVYPKILSMIGEAPESVAAGDSEVEDAAAQLAMQKAAMAAGGR